MKDRLFLQLFSLKVKQACVVFFKVALLKKNQIVADLPTYTHTQSCSTFTLEPAVAPEGSSPFDLEFKGLGALATSLQDQAEPAVFCCIFTQL